MLDSVKRIASDVAKAGSSFMGAKGKFESAYRGLNGTGSTPQLSIRSK